MADLVDVRRVCVTCESYTEHICDVYDTALELVGIFLEILGLYCKTELVCESLYLIEPRCGVIIVVV